MTLTLHSSLSGRLKTRLAIMMWPVLDKATLSVFSRKKKKTNFKDLFFLCCPYVCRFVWMSMCT